MSGVRIKPAGFTIVELLVVIVVIAILAATSVVAYTGISQRAQDAEQVSDMNQFQKALELFYAEHGYYPSNAKMRDAAFVRDELGLTQKKIPSYCWASQVGQYCYVPRRGAPIDNWWDCGGADERCVSYALSYRLHKDPSTQIRVTSLN